MLKQLHKIIIYNCLICCLFFNSFAIAQDFELVVVNTPANEQMKFIQSDINVKDIDIEPLNTQKVKQNVIPDTKKESKKIIGLFLKTMAAVSFCAVILYITLVFVKKYYTSAFVNNDNEIFEALDLSSPQDKQEALKIIFKQNKITRTPRGFYCATCEGGCVEQAQST